MRLQAENKTTVIKAFALYKDQIAKARSIGIYVALADIDFDSFLSAKIISDRYTVPTCCYDKNLQFS